MGMENGWKHVKRIAAAVGLLTAPMAEAKAQEAPSMPITSVGAQNVSFYDETKVFEEPQAGGLSLETPASFSDVASTPEIPITESHPGAVHDDTPLDVHIPGTGNIPVIQNVELGKGPRGKPGITWRDRF